MSISGIQGRLLQVTVAACHKLKDTEWISRQDPYVCLEYDNTKYRTGTCKDGGKNPTFQEKFTFTLIEGLRELNVMVWNRNTMTPDAFIGSGKIQLQKVLSQGYDDSSWPIMTKDNRHAGEVKLILHYSNVNMPATSYAPSAPPYVPQFVPQVLLYSIPMPTSAAAFPAPVATYSAPPPGASCPLHSTSCPRSPCPPPSPSAYPPPHIRLSSQESYYHPSGPYPGNYPQPPY